MATLVKRKNGSFEVHFYDQGSRKYVTLGKKYSAKTATTLKETVETLLYYKNNGISAPDKRVAVWIQEAPMEIQDKLANVGLIGSVCHFGA